MRALRSNIGLKVSVLWSSVWRSYALGLATAAGPIGIVLASRLVWNLPLLLVLVLSAMLGVLGWSLGLALLAHPLRAEVRLLAQSVTRRFRKDTSQRRHP